MRHVMNFTDVDDRTILESQKAGVPLREYTTRYIDAFLEDARGARARARRGDAPRHRRREHRGDGADHPGARTQRAHLRDRRLDLLQDLDAPRVRQARAPRSRRASRAARASTPTSTTRRTRATSCCGRRRSRASRPGTPASARAGRAGTSSARRWRCACSASRRSTSTAGGVDLIFPHHENEIAQSEGATGRPFARFWVHVEHLMIEDEDKGTEKMSKSLGNVYNLADIVAHGFRPSALRYLYLGTHYRKQLKFSWTAMAQAEEALKRDHRFPRAARPRHGRGVGARPTCRRSSNRRRRRSRRTSRDDLNTAGGARRDVRPRPRAQHRDRRRARWRAARTPRRSARRSNASTACSACCRSAASEDEQPPVPVDEIEQLIEARRAARLARNFAEADRIRQDARIRGHPARGHRFGHPLETQITPTSMTAPDIKTALPGPKAKAIIEKDQRSSSLPPTRATIRSSSPAAKGRWSKTSTATAFSTAPPASR